MAPRSPRLFHLMSLAQHRLLKAVDAVYKDALGITSTQLGVLFILEKNPGALLKEVSEALGINASAITALIARMEDARLVRRRASSEDRRAFHLFATAEGITKAAAAKPILARLDARLTHGFSARDLATVARFLNAVLERF